MSCSTGYFGKDRLNCLDGIIKCVKALNCDGYGIDESDNAEVSAML